MLAGCRTYNTKRRSIQCAPSLTNPSVVTQSHIETEEKNENEDGYVFPAVCLGYPAGAPEDFKSPGSNSEQELGDTRVRAREAERESSHNPTSPRHQRPHNPFFPDEDP
jgi:hypothetical protein